VRRKLAPDPDAAPDAVVAPSLMIGASDGRHFVRVSDSVYRFVPFVIEPDDLTRVEYLRRLAQLYREYHEPKHATTALDQLLQISPGDLQSIKTLIELAEQIASQRAQEATDAEKAVTAKTLELVADGELSKADREQIANLETVAATKRAASIEAANHANAMREEANAGAERASGDSMGRGTGRSIACRSRR